MNQSPATLSGNTITANTANGAGGGLYIDKSDATLTNNIVADNQAKTDEGGGLFITACSPRLLHTTIARNTSMFDSGIYVTNDGSNYSTVAMTNTILVSHAKGIHVESGAVVKLESTLWNGNDTDWDGAGTINRSNDHFGDPVFANPNAGDYHITPGSAAIDAAVDAGVDVDIDGDDRPFDGDRGGSDEFDIGADELAPRLAVTKQANPDVVQAGAQLTYTMYVTNTGYMTLTATVTDTLPGFITLGETSGGTLILAGGVVTWTPTIAAPGGVWMETIVVTVEAGYAGLLTNVVEVTTREGATGIYTETVLSLAPHLEVTKQAEHDVVQAGAQLTYTLRVTNTGNVDLHATITDTLPEHVSTAQPLVWTSLLIPASGGVWIETVVVTVDMGYAGPLTNVVHVATQEGASGTDACTTTSVCTPLQSVSISGTTTALSGTAVTLNAVYTPTDATDPTLLWDNGETGSSTNYTWPQGVHSAVVTASAACGEPVTATHTVTVTVSAGDDRFVYLPLVMNNAGTVQLPRQGRGRAHPSLSRFVDRHATRQRAPRGRSVASLERR